MKTYLRIAFILNFAMMVGMARSASMPWTSSFHWAVQVFLSALCLFGSCYSALSLLKIKERESLG